MRLTQSVMAYWDVTQHLLLIFTLDCDGKILFDSVVMVASHRDRGFLYRENIKI